MTITHRDVAAGAKAIGAGTIWAVLAVVAIGGLSIGLWAFGVFTSDAKGVGDVYRHQQGAGNREHWSATFNGEFQQINADRDNLIVLKAAAAGTGATRQDRTDYTGAQLNCRTDVAQYNADASGVLGSPWIPSGLPAQITADTYCGS